VHVPKQRKILYPDNPEPPLSVEAPHVKFAVEAVVEAIASDCGIVGGVPSTVTVVVAVLDPLEFVTVRV
jgi:hypothetical protein